MTDQRDKDYEKNANRLKFSFKITETYFKFLTFCSITAIIWVLSYKTNSLYIYAWFLLSFFMILKDLLPLYLVMPDYIYRNIVKRFNLSIPFDFIIIISCFIFILVVLFFYETVISFCCTVFTT